jgi:hypothetical protein
VPAPKRWPASLIPLWGLRVALKRNSQVSAATRIRNSLDAHSLFDDVISLFDQSISLFRQKNSLFSCVGNFAASL